MKGTELYQFELPQELIAQQPAHPRDSARLLVYKLEDSIIHDAHFYDLPKYLNKDTTLVLNNSKVENCRWLFDDSKIELFIVEKTDTHTVRAMVRPGKKFKNQSVVKLTDWLQVTVTAIDDDGVRTLRLSVPHNDARLVPFEHIPLPPYITKNDSLAVDYQTVYAKPSGSLAAPTAGLHFTEPLLKKIQGNHKIAEVTLHVGLGTFAKLTDENMKSGRLHSEWYSIDELTADILNSATHRTAIGTTSIRTLESNIDDSGVFHAEARPTDIFIRPGYRFQATDSVVTNFHLPSTSLLMLIAAFLADKLKLTESDSAAELLRIYNHAIKSHYRFYSFGDAMLIV